MHFVHLTLIIGLHQPYASSTNKLRLSSLENNSFPTSGTFRSFSFGVFKVLHCCVCYGGDNGGWSSGTFCHVLEVIHSLNRPVQIDIAQMRSNTQ